MAVSEMRISLLRIALTIPSFYATLSWGIWFVLYELRLLAWEPDSPVATMIFIAVLLVFLIAFLTALRPYRRWHEREATGPKTRTPVLISEPHIWTLVTVLHVAGFVGLLLYIRMMAAAFGGLSNLIEIFVLSSFAIRGQSELTASIGTQLSYFGWIAIALTVQAYRDVGISRSWLLIAVLQLLGNLIYIDRTRPIWILFTCLLVGLVAKAETRAGLGMLIKIGVVTAVFIGVFLGIATWVGKIVVVGQYGESALPPFAQNIYSYGTQGFAYFNRLVDAHETVTYVPERILYPLFKLLAGLGLTEAPPSQINEFFYVPFPTNVGTFLEPFYRDGGYAFLIPAVLLQSFGLDVAGHALLTSGRPIARFAWANLCFVAFIGFFTPKIAAFPIWLFLLLGILSAVSFRRASAPLQQRLA